MLLVRKMNLDEREEGEITEYEDISSDEEILLRQRIAEIEQLASLSNKVDEKENTNGRKKSTATQIVALAKVKSSSAAAAPTHPQGRNYNGPPPRRRATNHTATERSSSRAVKPKPKPKPPAPVLPAKRRARRSKRLRRHSCQLIISDDEFDSYDPLPLGTENLSPDPLPIDDDNDDVVVDTSAEVIVIDEQEAAATEDEDEDEDDDLELKLRLEALQSKQEIKNDLQVILDQTRDEAKEEAQVPPCPAPPPIDEEQELRLIALKSAIVKKHWVRKKRKEEARPYSPTDDALESFDAPSPPMSAQNMDISPLGTPSPFSAAECENQHPVDMDIANEESQSPIFFSCTINTEPTDPVATALTRVEIQMDPATMVADSGYDDEDPDKLRAFLLKKIGEAAQRKSMRVESDSLTEAQKKNAESASIDVATDEQQRLVESPAQRVTEHRHSDSTKAQVVMMVEQEQQLEDDDDEDEHVLRANLLSKAKRFKRAKSEEAVSKTVPLTKPLSEILNDQSKKVMEFKTICRTIENDHPTTIIEEVVNTPSIAAQPPPPTPLPAISTPSMAVITTVQSPKPVTPTPRNALISQLRVPRVTPVIISLRASDDDDDSSSEYSTEGEEDEESYIMDVGDNSSPLSIAMDSPQYSSSPVPMLERTQNGSSMTNATGERVLKENFDEKLSEFLKKARQSTGPDDVGAVAKLPMKRIVTSRKIVKKVVGIRKTVGLANAVQSAAPAAVKHLPPSTQLEYNRLISRMHQLERQKLIRSKKEAPKVKAAVGEAIKAGDNSKPSALPVLGNDNVTVIRKIVDLQVDVPSKRTPITVLVHNDKMVVSKPLLPVVPPTVVAKKVPLTAAAGGVAVVPAAEKSTVTPTPQPPTPSTGGRITLKDRLKSLTAEQMKMLLDVQQRKVVNKRKNLNQSLDTFLGTMTDTMAANRQQIRVELEVRRLRRMLKLREAQLAEQRQLCSGQLHERLQSQYKAVAVARQSLATTSSQCLEIGRSASVEGETNFRLTDEGSEGLGAKFKKYKAEIETYKELRGKIKQGVFTIADLKSEAEAKKDQEEKAVIAAGPVVDKAASPNRAETPAIPVQEQQEEKEGESAESKEIVPKVVVDRAEISKPPLESNAKSKEAVMEVTDKQTKSPLGETMKIVGKPDLSFPVYKSPLEHMEYLDTANPNGILCPFQLNGTCHDENCSYRHLSVSSS